MKTLIKPFRAICFCAVVVQMRVVAAQTISHEAQAHSRSARPKIEKAYGKLPLEFEMSPEMGGGPAGQAQFVSRGNGYALLLRGDEEILAFDKGGSRSGTGKAGDAAGSAALRMRLLGANAAPPAAGLDELPGKVNYFFGDDRGRWRTNLRTYARVKYEQVYPGVDLVFYGNRGRLEYDFVVAPGAKTEAIRLQIDGAERPRIDGRGNLVLARGNGSEVLLQKPVVYQESARGRQRVKGRYAVAKTDVTFQIGDYDRAKPLIIDPALLYATYLGGSGADHGHGIAVDLKGDAYITGYTFGVPTPGSYFPFTDTFPLLHPIQSNLFEECAFVSELNPSGTALIYSTFLCDTDGSNFTPATYGRAIAVDAQGNAYVAGDTYSDGTPHFPVVNALQATAPSGSTAFLTKIAPGGTSLVFSTYLGAGHESGYGVALDPQGNIYVTGSTASTTFPTFHALQPHLGGAGPNAFISKINPSGSAFVYSTYLGGNTTVPNLAGVAGDEAKAIAVDASGDAYITGITASSDFPMQNAEQGKMAGDYDAFVSELNPDGSALIYSTYLGGSGGDQANAIALDVNGDAFVAGTTTSQDFPKTPNCLAYGVYNVPFGVPATGQQAFISEISTGGTLGYSSILDTNFGPVIAFGIGLDSAGNVYATGLQTSGGATYSFATEVSIGPSTSTRDYFSGNFLSGAVTWPNVLQGNALAVDANGDVYIAGTATGGGAATFNSFQTTFGGGASDVFVAKIGNENVSATTLTLSPTTVTFGPTLIAASSPTGASPLTQDVTLTNAGANPAVLSNITASGDYSATSNCPTELLASASCTITVSFAPTSGGTRTGTLTALDSASNSPQTTALTGQGEYEPIGISTGSSVSQFPEFTEQWAVTVSNSGPGVAIQPYVNPISITPSNASSDPTSPNFCIASFGGYGPGGTNISGNLSASSSGTALVPITFVGCLAKPMFTLVYSVVADGQTVSTNTVTVQLQ